MRITTIIMLLCLNLLLFAAPVEEAVSRDVAESFLQIRGVDKHIMDQETIGNRAAPNAYVYQLDEPGFIIVSADNQLPPVLAYSFKHGFINDPENPLVSMINADIANRMAWFADQGINEADPTWETMLTMSRPDPGFQQWPADGSTTTDGWLLTRWNQSGVYNDMCPLDNGGERSVVGCVATAMSMLIYYHQHIGDVSFDQSDAYVSGWWNGIAIDGDHEEHDFPSFSELNGYLDTLGDHIDAGIDWTAQDYAALNFAAGISVQMSYSSDGSGSWTELVASALPNKFDYDSAFYMDWSYSLLDMLAEEMKYARPTELSINTPDYDSGHAINCDGYNTDDYYHLNFGWGSSDSSCWYILPEGMPSGYTIVSGMVYNIEGGEHPVHISGNVNVDGSSAEGAYVFFDGDYDFEVYVDNASGSYDIPAIFPGTYTATATLGNRMYFDQFEITIDENTTNIDFDLANYEALTGQVNASVATDGAGVCLYKDGRLLGIDYADEYGNFSFPEILPGTYTLSASAGDGYFGSAEFTLTADDQDTDVEMTLREGKLGVGFSGTPDEIFSIGIDYTLSCGIRLSQDDLTGHEGEAIRAVRFKTPISSEEGEITAEVWMGEQIIAEQVLESFEANQWYEVEVEPYVLIDPAQEYFVGYHIHAVNGNVAWHDNGPRVTGKGALICTTSWVNLTTAQDFNFNIDAVISAVDYGTINGQITVDDTRELRDAMVGTGNFIAHADDSGYYSLELPAGTYDIYASFTDCDPEVIEGIEITAGEVIDDVDFVMDPTNANEPTEVPDFTTALAGNFPNPFNPETRIQFSLANDSHVSLSIYNIRGQKVKTLANSRMTQGSHSVVWNGTDETGKSLASGIYMMRLQAGGDTFARKMMLIK